MQDYKPRPKKKQIEQAHQAKEQRHVDSRLVANLLLHHDRVHPVQDRAESGHRIAESDFARALLGECAAVRAVCFGEVEARDEDDAY